MERRNFIKTVTALGAGIGMGKLTAAVGPHGSDNNPYNSDHNLYDVVIVGAGLSGLVAAHELKKMGRSVVVVEAKPRVGGRTQNQLSVNGVIVDAGGQWFGPSQTEIIALADELGVMTFKTWNQGRALILDQGQVSRDTELPPDSPEQADYLNTVKRINKMAATVPLDAPWTAPNAQSLDAQLLGTWLDQNMTTLGARIQIEAGVASIQIAPSSQISLLWFLFYVHSGGFWERLQNIDNGAQEGRFVGGSHLLSQKMAMQLSDSIILGNPVRKIEQESQYMKVDLRYGELKTHRVIVAMMPADANRIRFEPRLPKAREQLNANWSTASGVKAHLIYPTPFWRDQGLSGIANTDTGVGAVFDNSPHDASFGVLLAFIELEQLPADPQMRKAEVINVLSTLFGTQATNPLDYLEKDWNKENFNAGCESPLGPGVLTQYGESLRQPVGPIHWAGTETAIEWNGYMEGAVRAGKRAAEEVVAVL